MIHTDLPSTNLLPNLIAPKIPTYPNHPQLRHRNSSSLMLLSAEQHKVEGYDFTISASRGGKYLLALDDPIEEAATSTPLIADASKKALREKLGLHDLGLALFSPIHDELLTMPHRLTPETASPVCRQDREEDDYNSTFSQREGCPIGMNVPSSSLSDDEGEDCVLPLICIEMPSDPTELHQAPPIISEGMLQQLVEDGLPSSLQIFSSWKRLFSISVHGDCVSTMMDRCGLYRHTLIVGKTGDGTILGGFASERWRPRASSDQCQYYGNGSSFLFSSFPLRQDGKLNVYKWVGANDYCQLCDIPSGRIALGGGGNFGLILQDNFMRGSSGRCATFENSCLVPGMGNFDLIEFEVYGIVPLIQTAHFR
jgi:hypothetical protein